MAPWLDALMIDDWISCVVELWLEESIFKQESPAVAYKPARRESTPKIAPIRRVYNVVTDNTGLSSFV